MKGKLKVKIKKGKRTSGVILLSSMLIAGCQGTGNVVNKNNNHYQNNTSSVPPSSISVGNVAPDKGNKVALCQNELASLKKVSPNDYEEKKAYFDSLLNSVSVYASVRGDINTQTKDTLDALYKYKTNQVCAEIERDVLQGLIRRGESVK
ncbi:hypothetical protein [Serratia fonticola]|uniref:hypothetical protein n=1 Tax=Serratia fonticola TaxID=47917 RepID=UPI0027EAB9D7|nr:hypothetical protein [Serratia fonticola]MDQ7212045.1 hypothetical protein [Serratia fonticola]HBE9082900.1 hypothetical protein [Serratia fonticola]HBE9093389.1 hypothetical protein [Serratia fonticola]HBE9155752.1 hypothetical protein [Serratia fonticola]